MSTLTLRSKISRAQEMVLLVQKRPFVRKGWPALGILFILPGVFGNATPPPPSPTISRASGVDITVTYEPIVRLHTPTIFSLSIMSVFGKNGQFSIRVGNTVSDNFSISHVNPIPVSTSVDRNGTVYIFSAEKTDTVVFTLVPEMVGNTAATIQYGLDIPVAFSLATR